MVDLFLQPLQDALNDKPIMNKDKIQIIFSNVRTILQLNTTFLEDLTKRLETWTSHSGVGDLFCHFSHYFLLYTEFVNNHANAVTALDQLRKNKKLVRNFLNNAESNPECKGMNLGSFLIMPIQRVPRYKLLLGEMLKHTATDHEDYDACVDAEQLVADVAKSINEAMKGQDQLAHILRVGNLLGEGTSLVSPGRVFIKEGLLWKRAKKRDNHYMWFLFNDLLVYSDSKATGGFTVKYQLPINRSFAVAPLPDELTPNHPPRHCFQILSEVKSFLVYTESQVERDSWFQELSRLSAEASKKDSLARGTINDAKVVMVPDASSKTCPICDMKWTLTSRRHHCRTCGALCCANCSQTRRVLSANQLAERVCDRCERKHMHLQHRDNVKAKAEELKRAQKKSEAMGGLPLGSASESGLQLFFIPSYCLHRETKTRMFEVLVLGRHLHELIPRSYEQFATFNETIAKQLQSAQAIKFPPALKWGKESNRDKVEKRRLDLETYLAQVVAHKSIWPALETFLGVNSKEWNQHIVSANFRKSLSAQRKSMVKNWVTMSELQSEAPEGWTVHVVEIGPNRGKWYYFNEETQESLWTPLEYGEEADRGNDSDLELHQLATLSEGFDNDDELADSEYNGMTQKLVKKARDSDVMLKENDKLRKFQDINPLQSYFHHE